MLLKTNRIYLRPLRKSDAKYCWQAVEETRNELELYMDWTPVTQCVQDVEIFIANTIQRRKSGTTYTFGIFKKGENKYLGNIALENIRYSNQSAEIGYWVRNSSAGNGIATEASAVILKMGFELLKLNKIILRAASDNHASNKIAKKLGFIYDGIQRAELKVNRGILNMNCYSILADEYYQQKEKIEQLKNNYN